MAKETTEKLVAEEDISDKKKEVESVAEGHDPKDKAGDNSDADMTNEEKNETSELA